MKSRLLRIGTIALLFAATMTPARTIHEAYEVATWRGFRTAAISYTFDDGTPNQFAVAVPMFNEAGLKLTLFTVTESEWAFPGWDKLQAAADAGHEIASHTASHNRLAQLSYDQQVRELQGSRQAIESHLNIPAGLTLAYPYCVSGNDELVLANYLAARSCSGQVVPASPPDFLQISSVGCGELGSVNQLADFQSTAVSAAAQGGWMVYLLHGVDQDGGYSPLTSNTLQASVDFFVENEGTYWVETFGNVIRYIRERDDVSVTETSLSADRITLEMTDTLDDTVYNTPLTLRRSLPDGWPAARVSQDGLEVPARVYANARIEFEAVPDAGEIVLERTDGTPRLSVGKGEHPGHLELQREGPSEVDYAVYRANDLKSWTDIQQPGVKSPAKFQVQATNAPQFFRAEVSNHPSPNDPPMLVLSPAHPHLRYSGRSTGMGTGAVNFGYSGARVRLRFEGTSITLRMDDEFGENHVVVFLDGESVAKLRLNAPDGRYLLADGLEPGEHTVEIVRATEGNFGLNHFRGFEIGGHQAQVLPWPETSPRRIEFIGDSITCGYGVEVDDPNLSFTAVTENFCLGYTGLTVRALDADYLVVSRSGIGMVRNFDGPYDGSEDTMPDVYPATFYLRAAPTTWDHRAFTPDVVCINLGTNDFSTTGVNVERFTATYAAFGEMLLARYPDAKLVILQGPMYNGDDLRSALETVANALSEAAPGRVHFFKLSPQGGVGFGADWHPNRAQSEINAAELTTFLRDLMDWR